MKEPSAQQLQVIQCSTFLATNVCHKFLTLAQYPQADLLHRLFRQFFEKAGYAGDAAALASSFRSLPESDRAALMTYIREIYSRSPESPLWDPLEVLDNAMSMHWIKSFGLGAVGDDALARLQLGEESAERLEAFIHKKIDKFWELDALAEKLDAEPLSVEDMRIVGASGTSGSNGQLLTEALQFANTEALREELRAGGLKLPREVVAILQDGLSRELQRIRPDRPPVSIMEWLT